MLILLVSAFFVNSCKTDSQTQQPTQKTSGKYVKINGKTMGTTYHITYEKNPSVSQEVIDRLLVDVNQSVSSYIPTSEISQFNRGSGSLILMPIQGDSTSNELTINGQINPAYVFNHFESNLEASRIIWKQSDGLFDPTLMPLVNYWGFGYKGHEAVDQVNADSIKLLIEGVGLDLVTLETVGNTTLINKKYPSTQLDFSAIAKGYGVDLVLYYLESCGVQNAMVEIGGETSTIGTNPSQKSWTIGINTPDPNARVTDFEVVIKLNDAAIASSGNYRNYRVIAGQRYGHEINPKTGYPIQTDVLSASVIAPDCQLADGYATACMVMGVEKSLEMIESIDGVEVLLISDKDGEEYTHHYSSGFKAYIVK